MYCNPIKIINEENLPVETYRKTFNAQGYKQASLHLNVSENITTTLFASNNPDADDTSDDDWVDVTNTLAGSETITNTETIIKLTDFITHKLMIKQVVNNATNSIYAYLAGNI